MFDWDCFFSNMYLDINPQEGFFFLLRSDILFAVQRSPGRKWAAHSSCLWLLIKRFMMRDVSNSEHVY